MAIVKDEKDVNGAIKTIIEMSRLKTSNNPNAKFDIEDFPVNFLSVKYGDKISSDEKGISEFTEKYLYPLIEKDGQKLEAKQAMKNIRNINMMTYCNGTEFALEVEKLLINEMYKIGYEENDIDKIINQMCVFPISTNMLDGKQVKASYMSFRDINDIEVGWWSEQERKDFIKNFPFGEEYGMLGGEDSAAVYCINGNGEHRLKHMIQQGIAMPTCISSSVSKALNNAIKNHFEENDNDFSPISLELLVEDYEKYIEQGKSGKTKEEIMKGFDEQLKYTNVNKKAKYSYQINKDNVGRLAKQDDVVKEAGNAEEILKEAEKIIENKKENENPSLE